MSKLEGKEKALILAKRKLQEIDLFERCKLHGFTELEKNKSL